MILPSKIHPSWKPFFTGEVLTIIGEITNKIRLEDEKEITPLSENILRFLNIDLSKAKIIILGQDPYPQKGIATGRAFEVGPLQSWTESFRNTSLRNIVRALYYSETKELKNFQEIKKELAIGSFSLLSPSRLFTHWEQQGVLLLNTSFSCTVGKPGSHSRYWKPFTDRLLEYVNKIHPEIIWFLWGNHAQKAVEHIDIRKSIFTTHPMICHKRENDFLFGKTNVFEVTKDLIDWTGRNEKASSENMQKRLW